MYTVCIDIGGTNIRSAIINENCDIIELVKKKSSPLVINDIKQSIKFFSKKYLFNDIGISIGGVVDKDKGEILFVNEKIGSWKTCQIVKELNLYFNNQYNIKIDNDGNCAALAEKYYGNAKDCNNFINLVLGTGVGIGCFINNKLIKYSEIGKFIEDKCSGKYFDSQRNKNLENMDLIYLNGAKFLALKISELIMILNPEKIIINGPLINCHHNFKKYLNDNVFIPSYLNTKIIFSKITNQGLIGALCLFK